MSIVYASADFTFFVTFYHLAVVLVCIVFQCNVSFPMTFALQRSLEYALDLREVEGLNQVLASHVFIVGFVTSSPGCSDIVTGHNASLAGLRYIRERI